ncbi:transcription factor bHLH110 isoform X2 [Amaranthus tricolor]|uniref:transcription factor bHLH110 isoform X2 n=1 Tax=Amaranthus tricolor TaxID=29722 RepID=UPI002588D4FB|nr:transcription factor bHLH110 isoform X2 [Amaranthus tricolor]
MCGINMDSTNLHNHHLHEDELVIGSSNAEASFPSPCFSIANNEHSWRNSPTFFLNNGNIQETCAEVTPSSLNNPIIQYMGYSWSNDPISINQSSSHQENDHQLKEEPSPSTSSDHHHHHSNSNLMTFSDMLNSSLTSPNEMLLLNNPMISNNRKLHQHQPSNSAFPSSIQYQNSKGMSTTFSHIFPSINISNMSSSTLSSSSSSSSSSIDQMANNLQGGFDLFTTARLLSGESLNHCTSPNIHLLELFEGRPQLSIDQDLQQSNDQIKLSDIANNNKSAPQMPSKKQRFDSSRPSCPPFKVRKEKLGDRIAALQQLVAPFGKTDTASVLMEAIGYIKFLQSQVETLSVPYMKLASSSNNSSNTQRGVEKNEYGEDEETKVRDLRSRGLCLVPLSCMSYINIATDAINGAIWPPTNFNPASGF